MAKLDGEFSRKEGTKASWNLAGVSSRGKKPAVNGLSAGDDYFPGKLLATVRKYVKYI
jgi:hypothetical protein